YRERLLERSRERFERWNDVAIGLKRNTIPIVVRKISSVVAEHGLPESFVDIVQWNILHVCMEAEYADVYPPRFYAGLAYWYFNGHFPCAWEGEFPRGRPIIY